MLSSPHFPKRLAVVVSALLSSAATAHAGCTWPDAAGKVVCTGNLGTVTTSTLFPYPPYASVVVGDFVSTTALEALTNNTEIVATDWSASNALKIVEGIGATNVGAVLNNAPLVSQVYFGVSYTGGTLGAFTNNSVIQGSTGVMFGASGTVNKFVNNGSIYGVSSGPTWGAGMIIAMPTQGVGEFVNTGVIASIDGATAPYASAFSGTDATHGLVNSGTIDVLTNVGSIYTQGTGVGIQNSFQGTNGVIGVLNNAQGASNPRGALTYSGALPSFYNVIITNNAYGQLSAITPTGAMQFGIFGGSGANGLAPSVLLANHTYTSVLSGVGAGNLVGPLTGVYGGLSWRLALEAGQTDIWDLIVTSSGPDGAATLSALRVSQGAQTNLLRQRAVAMAGLLGVDCADFGAHGVCVSLQMRTQTSGHQGDGGGRATAALRLAPNLRIGAAIDIAPIASAPAGLTQADQNPSFAAFAAYGAANGLGLSARISGALRNGAATISRDPGLGAEFGHGRAGLRAYGVAGEIGWGFAMRDGLVLTPFVGLRHLRATRGAYVEQLNAATSYPIMLDALSERSLTGSAGLRMRAQLTSGFALSASASAEYDFARASGALTGWSAIPGIERFALPSSGQGARLRAAGGLGAEYAWTPLQKFVVSMTAGGIAYSNRAFISTRAGYQISF